MPKIYIVMTSAIQKIMFYNFLKAIWIKFVQNTDLFSCSVNDFHRIYSMFSGNLVNCIIREYDDIFIPLFFSALQLESILCFTFFMYTKGKRNYFSFHHFSIWSQVYSFLYIKLYMVLRNSKQVNDKECIYNTVLHILKLLHS